MLYCIIRRFDIRQYTHKTHINVIGTKSTRANTITMRLCNVHAGDNWHYHQQCWLYFVPPLNRSYKVFSYSVSSPFHLSAFSWFFEVNAKENLFRLRFFLFHSLQQESQPCENNANGFCALRFTVRVSSSRYTEERRKRCVISEQIYTNYLYSVWYLMIEL